MPCYIKKKNVICWQPQSLELGVGKVLLFAGEIELGVAQLLIKHREAHLRCIIKDTNPACARVPGLQCHEHNYIRKLICCAPGVLIGFGPSHGMCLHGLKELAAPVPSRKEH